ncbi:MAG: hypothetical protein ABIO92_06525 [Chloroflexia bacterium]
MNSEHKPNMGERYISHTMKQVLKYPYAHVLNLAIAALWGVATILGFPKSEIPLSVVFLIIFLSWARLWYERLQFSRMVSERDSKIAQLSRMAMERDREIAQLVGDLHP